MLRKSSTKVWVSAGAVASIVLVGTAIAATGGDGDERATASVVDVIDGMSVRVELSGEERDVRLLNVATPPVTHDQTAVQCLGEESAEFLEGMLSAGTEVELEYDLEAEDDEGRVLAGVFLDDELVNASVAAAGFGVAVHQDPNEAFFEAVQEGEESAHTAEEGLFDPALECSLPQQVSDVESEVALLVASVPDDLPGIQSARSKSVALLALADKVRDDVRVIAQDDFPVLTALYSAEQDAFAKSLDDDMASLRSYQQQLDEAQDEIEAEEQRKKEEEAELKRQEEEKRRLEAEAAAAAEEAQRQNSAPAPAAEPAPAQGGSAYYANCDAVRAAGAAPIYAGDPGFQRKFDRDGDGVGCE